MEKCVIFCAAEFDALIQNVNKGDFLIAADGGLIHCEKLGLRPDVILGDFDSLGYVPQGAQVHPVEKDDTDAMLAVRLGLEKGFREFVIYGGLDGPRLDHTVANFQTLQYLADHGAGGFLVGQNHIVTVLKDGAVVFDTDASGIISVFCMGRDAEYVTIRGLQYELDNGSFSAGFPLGVSNHFIGKNAEISVKNGSLLLIWERKNGFPHK